MKWRKLGVLIGTPAEEGVSPEHPWKSHAMCPTPVHLHGDVYRIYFGGRDANNRGIVLYADVNIVEAAKRMAVSNAIEEAMDRESSQNRS